MFTLVAVAVLLAIVAGLIVKFALDWMESEMRVTWTEFAIVAVVVTVVVAPLTGWAGWSIAKGNVLSFNEYWNGWELAATVQETVCTRDGWCSYEYSCDPYTVTESYSCGEDNKETCYRTVTKYHDCPYATAEYTYSVATTLGDYVIDNHVFAENPVEWRAGSGIPAGVQRGPSAFWLEAKTRCDAGRPGPVTKRMTYDNFILASDKTILRQYSDMIEAYKAQGLLPPVQAGIDGLYYALKVQFVDYQPSDPIAWQMALMYLDAALGTELQGDLHLVIVQNDTVSVNPDAYIIALKAYWQDPALWGDNAISKNSIIVAIGTDGQTVGWARATTGMPLGNEHMTVAIRNNLKGVELTPEAVLGSVKGELYVKTYDDGSQKTKVRGIGESGALRRILWGLDDPQTKFVRVSMTANDPGDVGGGFLYLDSEIEPTGGQKAVTVIAAFLLSCIGWVVAAAVGEEGRRRYYRRYY